MKNLFRSFIMLLFCYLSFGQTGHGQDRIVQRACYDSALKLQADTVKNALAEKGFILVREATVTMESQYEMPVIVPLTAGTYYQFVFIGDPDSKLYEVRMYDWTEKQVVYKKNGIENNLIGYGYVPVSSEYHVIKPVQVSNIRKKKQLCGYILMFKKVTQNMGAE